MKTVQDIYDYLDREYPFSAQEEWDNSGLLCGSAEQSVTKCLVCLDADISAVCHAAQEGAQLIISHHPIIFSAKKRLLQNDPAFEAVNRGISVISAHTNFDCAPKGCANILGEILGLPVRPVAQQLFQAAHLSETMTAGQLASLAARRLNAPVQCVNPEKEIRILAVCTGAGGSELEAAADFGADCYLTGELKYHEFLDCVQRNLAVVAAGHFETEDIACEVLAKRLREAFVDIDFIKQEAAPPYCWITR